MDPQIVSEIREKLKALELREEISIPLAIESGSRAWGFPSPDSDYDCRFIYIRKIESTFTLFPPRDVIEEPLTPVFDINGWDLSKALRLMHSGNAVVIEWLTSVFAYQVNEEFRDAAIDLANEVCDRGLIGKHYFHLAKAQVQRLNYFEGEVSIKKTLYALRPLAALMWLTANPDKAFPPMNFNELRQAIELPKTVSSKIDELLAQKAERSELGAEKIDPDLSGFMLALFESFEPWAAANQPQEKHKHIIDAFWRDWSQKLAPK